MEGHDGEDAIADTRDACTAQSLVGSGNTREVLSRVPKALGRGRRPPAATNHHFRPL
jgi:hypothetical protein